MREVGYDVDPVAELLQGLQSLVELEAGPFLRGRPLVHGGAVRNVDAQESALGSSSGLRERCLCWNHGIEQRQRDRRSGATQKRSPRKMLFRDEVHCSDLPLTDAVFTGASSFTFI